MAGGLAIQDNARVIGLQVGTECHPCDGAVISGELVPNSELAVSAGLDVSQPEPIPARRGRNKLSAPGWFIAGGEIGGFHGADWCYQDGCCAGTEVAAYLRQTLRVSE